MSHCRLQELKTEIRSIKVELKLSKLRHAAQPGECEVLTPDALAPILVELRELVNALAICMDTGTDPQANRCSITQCEERKNKIAMLKTRYKVERLLSKAAGTKFDSVQAERFRLSIRVESLRFRVDKVSLELSRWYGHPAALAGKTTTTRIRMELDRIKEDTTKCIVECASDDSGAYYVP